MPLERSVRNNGTRRAATLKSVFRSRASSEQGLSFVHRTIARRTSGAGNMSPDVRSERRRIHLILGGIVVGAAILRFGTLGLQSFWSDEAATVDLVRMSLGHMLSALPDSERTPPVYYVLAWFWTRLFGSGEVGLRSLSALVGTLTVPIVFLLAKRVAGDRAGLIAATLTAVSPILVWYSQEARSYGLLVFLTAASVWLSLRARETRSPRWIVGWGVVACLAIATHYFASFVVVFEVLLIVGTGVRGRVLWAVLAVLGTVQLALAPLAAYQARTHEAGDYITATPLSSRVVDIPKRFLLGEPGAPAGTAGIFAVVLFVLLAITAWLFLKRLPVDIRRRSLALLALAVLATGLPLALVFVGLDFFAYRHLLAVGVLLAVIAAAALSTPHSYASVLAAGGLIVTFLALTIAFNVSPALQRADWKFSAQALGRPRWTRLIVLTPYFEAFPFQIYVPSARFTRARTVVVREVDLVGFRIPPKGKPPRLGRAFSRPQVINHQKLSFVRYVASRPLRVNLAHVPGIGVGNHAFLTQQPIRR
jgi:mannosyltransferase